MTYKLTINQKPTYLHAIVTGQNDRENVVRYLEEIRGECIARNCFRVLVEERLDGPRLGAMDVFQIVLEGRSKASGTYKAFAYVDVNADGGLMKFAETVAVNRGVPVAVFSTVADAETWLLNGDRDGTEPQAATAAGQAAPLSSQSGIRDAGLIEVVPFSIEHHAGVVDLVLPIQQFEFGIPITLEDQPDLCDIPGFYQIRSGNFWVALSGARVVGTISLLDIGKGRGALRKMFVHTEFRGPRYGVARRLLETLLGWCDKNQIREVYLGTTAKFVAAHRFYEQNGFTEVERSRLPPEFPVMVVDTKFYARVLVARGAQPIDASRRLPEGSSPPITER